MNKKYFSLLSFIFLFFIVTSCNNDDDDGGNIQPEAEKNIQKYVSVQHAAGSDTVNFEFSKTGKWAVYQGETVESIDTNTAAGTTESGQLSLTGLDPLQKYFFKVKLDEVSEAVVAETKVAVAGQPNMRDMGGMINKEGKSIVWGKVYRSGELGRLTDDDVQYLKSMQVDEVIDFRFEEEVTDSPDKLPEGVDYISLPIEDSLMHRSVLTQWLLSEDSVAFNSVMPYYYEKFVTEHQDAYKAFFDQLEEGKTVVFHCTAGKDRAGLAAALFLYALDMDDSTVMINYLKSNEYLEEFNQQTVEYVNSMGLNGALLWPMLVVKKEYLEKSLSVINIEYGGIDNYLRNNLDVDVEKLKELYLQP